MSEEIHGAGQGDYTRDRGKWLGELTIEQIEKELRQMKARSEI